MRQIDTVYLRLIGVTVLWANLALHFVVYLPNFYKNFLCHIEYKMVKPFPDVQLVVRCVIMYLPKRVTEVSKNSHVLRILMKKLLSHIQC